MVHNKEAHHGKDVAIMRRRALLFSALLLAFAGSGTASEGPRKPGTPALTGAPKVAIRGDFTAFDVNTISTFIRNNGSFNRDPITGYAGFIWPKGTGKIANYA